MMSMSLLDVMATLVATGALVDDAAKRPITASIDSIDARIVASMAAEKNVEKQLSVCAEEKKRVHLRTRLGLTVQATRLLIQLISKTRVAHVQVNHTELII
jgi:hypothetical protein